MLSNTVNINGIEYSWKGFANINDRFLVCTGAPFFNGQEGDWLKVTSTFVQFNHDAEYTGVQRVYRIWGRRIQFCNYINETSGVTGCARGFALVDNAKQIIRS